MELFAERKKIGRSDSAPAPDSELPISAVKPLLMNNRPISNQPVILNFLRNDRRDFAGFELLLADHLVISNMNEFFLSLLHESPSIM
jgi:hypothetical protein